jgi:steroid delta-isomerase-like uncharacterized protein
MPDPNESILAAHLAAENAHDLDAIMATYTASPVIELNGARIEGTAAVREFHRAFGFAGPADASFSDVHVAERRRHRAADAIVLEQTLTAKHTGSWRGVPPTGRSVSIALCTVYTFENGKLAREHVYLDEGRLRHALTKPTADDRFRSTRDVIIRTSSDEAVRFYENVMGFRVTMRREGMVGFETGSIQLFVEKGAPPHGPVFDMLVSDASSAKKVLLAAGCTIIEENPSVPRCYVRDPFGLVFNVEKT